MFLVVGLRGTLTHTPFSIAYFLFVRLYVKSVATFTSLHDTTRPTSGEQTTAAVDLIPSALQFGAYQTYRYIAGSQKRMVSEAPEDHRKLLQVCVNNGPIV